MPINGYARSSGKRSGGIKSIFLIEVEALDEIEYDYLTDCFTMVVFGRLGLFKSYDFKEGEAVYTEQVSVKDGLTSVKHTLTFSFEKIDEQSRRSVNELLSESDKGVVAVITTSNGENLLVGYSRKFEAQRALKVVSNTCTTGRVFADDTLDTVTLQSEDTSRSKLYTGTIEV